MARKGKAAKMMRVKGHLTAKAMAAPHMNMAKIMIRLPIFYPIAR